jgi:tetraacyldisaccharide 4'-kinase
MGTLATILAWPKSTGFRGLVALKNALYTSGVLRSRSAPIPVLGVGNLTVGGTGKTPVSAWFAARLAEAGARPALVARGYGRDELLLHERWNPSVPVVASADRLRAVSQAADEGASVVVLDDGFQHRRLAKDADVVLLAAETPFPGRMLPSGPYREPPSALRRADLVIVTRKSAPEARAVALADAVGRRVPDGIAVARAVLAPERWLDLSGLPASAPQGPVVVATAVADPEGVRVSVRGALAHELGPGSPVPLPELMAFPDHHEFGAGDVEALSRAAEEATLVVTEKDAVKLAEYAARLPGARVLALTVRWEAGESAVEAVVSRFVGDSSGDAEPRP